MQVTGILDTGASINILPISCDFTHMSIKPRSCKIATFSGEELRVLGKIPCSSVDGLEKQDIYFVLTEEGKSVLFGIDAIRKLKCLQDDLCSIKCPVSHEIDELIENFQVQEPAFGNIKGFEHRISINEKVTPVRQNSCHIPFALRDKVSAEIAVLAQHGIIEKIDASKWVSNLVVVQKPDERIRLCVDLREANKSVITDAYPLPRIEELLHSMKNCCIFSKQDLYLQLTLHESSRDLTVFVTPEGLFRFKRCPFALPSCPYAFKAVMSQILSGISGVACYLDDIVIAAEYHEEHEKLLEDV